MKIGSIITNDLANGPGIRVSVFVSGCPHHCEGCHNPYLWNENVGTELDDYVIDRIIYELKKDNIKRNLSILGGEPLTPDHLEYVYTICKRVKTVIPDINIWIWTGYDFNKILNDWKTPFIKRIDELADVIVDGKFIRELKSGHHLWRGSSNQRVLAKDSKGKRIEILKEDKGE